MNLNVTRSVLLSLPFVVAVLTALLASGVAIGTGWAVNRALAWNTVIEARHWRDVAADRIPNLPALLESGKPTPAQSEAIREMRASSQVFRFRLFDSFGREVLLFDEEISRESADPLQSVDPVSLLVLQASQEFIKIEDGRGTPGLPDVYAEAYVPLIIDGQILGVTEVYVDHSAASAYLTRTFGMLATGLLALSLIVLAVPAAGYHLQRRVVQRANSDIAFRAKHDPLTGLLNRNAFYSEADRPDRPGLTAVVCVDIDHLKVINDSYGRLAGDAVVRSTAERIAEITGPGDIVARVGGDEIVIGFRDVDRNALAERMRNLVKRCADPIEVDGMTICPSISAGAHIFGANESAETALTKADLAQGQAKSAGRNGFAIFGATIENQVKGRRELEARLRAGLDCDEFVLHFQPLIEAKSGKKIGYEALIRLVDADGGLIPPGKFIPIAEEIGLIEYVGAWVLHEATAQAATWKNDWIVAVNVSADQFRSGNIVDVVQSALDQSGLSPQRLELEITESVLIGETESIEFELDALKSMGVSTAMDDFGTGFSSLSYLWRYGFDRIKIDRSFISALDLSPGRALEVIETIVLLGRRLGMAITAEGIETEEQSRILRALGVDVLQGYYYGKPMALDSEAQTRPRATA